MDELRIMSPGCPFLALADRLGSLQRYLLQACDLLFLVCVVLLLSLVKSLLTHTEAKANVLSAVF